ncbi:MAG: hypothetical protein PHU85_10610 [Phycisphaerae bacterium]|nr:hypothetical protein [Phycisphaerae bacterium]
MTGSPAHVAASEPARPRARRMVVAGPGTARLALALLGLLAGCDTAQPRAAVRVQRAFLTPGQKVLGYAMETRRASYVRSEAGWCRVLLSFPLPGSAVGRPAYALFVQFRDDQPTHDFDIGRGEQAMYADLTRRKGEFNRASLASVGEMQTKWVRGGRALAGRLRFSTPDGLTIDGTFVAGFDPQAVTDFERDYIVPQLVRDRPGTPVAAGVGGRAIDLARVRSIATQPAESPMPQVDTPLIILSAPTTQRGAREPQ